MRKRIYWLVLGLIVVALGIYLNRAYAHIYDTITMVNLSAPKQQTAYIIGSAQIAKSTVYMAIGDSLTAGVGIDRYEESYPYLVAKDLASRLGGLTLESQSFPGARSGDLIGDPLARAIAAQPQIVTILVGINDVHGNISQAQFGQNYETLLSRLTQETNARVYVINIPYVGDNTLISWPYNYYFSWRIREFNRTIKDLAARYNVQYIDLYTPLVKVFAPAGPYYSADHFHPSAAGYALWAPIIYDHLH